MFRDLLQSDASAPLELAALALFFGAIMLGCALLDPTVGMP
jgi:hypothetical protein